MKTVLITGGNRGLGKALVDCFVAQSNWKVLATARNKDSLPDGIDAGYALDLSKHDDVIAVATALVEKNEPIDMIIHNAGFNPKVSEPKSIGM